MSILTTEQISQRGAWEKMSSCSGGGWWNDTEVLDHIIIWQVASTQ